APSNPPPLSPPGRLGWPRPPPDASPSTFLPRRSPVVSGSLPSRSSPASVPPPLSWLGRGWDGRPPAGLAASVSPARPARQKTGGQRLTDIPVFPGVRPAPAFVAGARVGRTPSRRSRGDRKS